MVVSIFAVLLLVATVSAQLQLLDECVFPAILYRPGTAAYGTLRGKSIYTKRGYPAGIAIPKNAQLVAQIVKCARKYQYPVCARSGGHAFEGRSLCQNGIMIDLSELRKFSINTATSMASLEPGLTLGETLWQAHRTRHWFNAGTCPGVGIAGYLLGGGFGPYQGPLGLACDALEEVTIVNRDGDVIKASRTLRQGLFNAMCGVGGGHFGIITEFKMKLPRSDFFDYSVVFRYNWPHNQIGNIVEKFMRFKPAKNDVYVRLVMGGGGDGIDGFGACFNVASIEDCKRRLSQWEFFNVPGRTYKFEGVTTNALRMGAFFGPAGKWGNQWPTNLWQAYNTYRFADAGTSNKNSDLSRYLTFPPGKFPSAAWWQGMADLVRDAGVPTNKWRTLQINMHYGKVKTPNSNLFAHRGSDAQIHYTLGPASPADHNKAYYDMAKYVAIYNSGVYPNYPDPRLSKIDYPTLYWGNRYGELQRLKSVYDPEHFFSTLQRIEVPVVA